MPLSSTDPCRLVNFFSFAGLAVDFLANDFLRDLGEVSLQGGIQFLEFRPQRLLDVGRSSLAVRPSLAPRLSGASLKRAIVCIAR